MKNQGSLLVAAFFMGSVLAFPPSLPAAEKGGMMEGDKGEKMKDEKGEMVKDKMKDKTKGKSGMTEDKMKMDDKMKMEEKKK
jgi:hypothetical protein